MSNVRPECYSSTAHKTETQPSLRLTRLAGTLTSKLRITLEYILRRQGELSGEVSNVGCINARPDPEILYIYFPFREFTSKVQRSLHPGGIMLEIRRVHPQRTAYFIRAGKQGRSAAVRSAAG